MRTTLARQSGSRKPLLRSRRTIQRTVVIGARPAPLLPQNGLLASTACTFSTTCVFAVVCTFRRAVVIRVRPAPSFDQYGLLASTACTFLRRLLLIVFGCFYKPARLCGGRPILGRLCCLLEAPGPPREARPPKVAQRHSKETVWVVWGCLLEFSGLPLGGLRAPKVTPKSLQGRGQYEASDLTLARTKASELKLHSSFPQGHWSSRAEAELAKRKQFGCLG